MTRKKEIVCAAKEHEKSTQFGELVRSKTSRGVNSAYGIGFLEGAEWADETMLAKACEFIDSHLHIVKEDIAYTNKEFLKDFRKEMKR